MKKSAIGVVLPQTGDLGPGEFGPGALVMENSFNMALEEINQSQLLGDASLMFIVEDDMSTIDGAITAFNKLIHQDQSSLLSLVSGPHTSPNLFFQSRKKTELWHLVQSSSPLV